MLKPTKSTLQKIEDILHDLEYTIRYERGNFHSGYCIVEKRKVIVINKYFDTEGRINCLLDILSAVEVREDMLSERSNSHYQLILKSEFGFEKSKESLPLS